MLKRFFEIIFSCLVLFFAFPVFAGLVGILLPAIGYFPALGKNNFSTSAAIFFLDTPGLWTASLLSLRTGLLATALSLVGCFILLTAFFGTPLMATLTRLLAPLVAIPHSAIAIGLVFLLAPSGYLMRLLSKPIEYTLS